MKNPMKTRGVPARIALLTLSFLVLSAAYAEAAPEFKPACGAEGDHVLIRGEDFEKEPVVKFDGVEAKVLRSNATHILCLVPEDTSLGDVSVAVDGDLADDDYTVLAAGSPVVLHMSSKNVTPGTPIYMVGLRLKDGVAEFVDSTGTTQAEVDLVGRRRAAMVEVPDDLDAGTYTLTITNGDELSTGACSPEIEVIEAGDPALDSIDPEDQLPGHRIVIEGTDLSPIGPCKVIWTDSAGDELTTLGFSNGYDKVVSRVPVKALAGETYDVVVGLRGGDETDSLSYDVGEPDAPEITKLDPDAGPAGSFFQIYGKGLLVLGSRPKVEMDSGTETLEAKVVFAKPAFRGENEVLVVMVPKDAADGDYDVTVTVGDETSKAETFSVEDQELTVDSMRPDSQGKRGPWTPIYIKGTGFGNGKNLVVTFDDGSGADPLEGKVIFAKDRYLAVMPPGGRKDPLAEGEYTVDVIRDPDGDADSVEAGTYTVK